MKYTEQQTAIAVNAYATWCSLPTYCPRGWMGDDDHNLKTLCGAIMEHVRMTGNANADTVANLYAKLVADGVKFNLDRSAEILAGIPHPELGINSVESYIAFVKKNARLLMAGTELLRKVEETGKYVQEHNIHDAVVEEKPLTVQEKAKKDVQDKWAVILSRIEKAKPGSAHDSVGRYKRVEIFAKRTKEGFWERIREGEGWEAAEKWVDSEIERFEGSSIR